MSHVVWRLVGWAQRSSVLFFTISMSGRGFGTIVGEVSIFCLLYFKMWHFDPKHGISEVTTVAANIGAAVAGLLALVHPFIFSC
jgi:hypothetical protein